MKVVKNIVIVLLLIGLFIPLLLPSDTEAASNKTLGYYEQMLAKYKKEAEETKKAIAKTESDIKSSKNKIENLKNETLALTDEIKKLNEEIDYYKESISDKLTESKQILEYLQLTSGNNVYLDYVFKATSVTELINRNYVVKEIVEYNTKVINEMEQIITDNEKRQEEIDKRKVEISKRETQLEASIVSLGEKKESLATGGVDTEKQIKIYEDIVAMYKKQGCKTNDVIGIDCAVQGGTGVFRRPTKTGYITQEAYFKSTSNYHRAVDIGSKNGKKEKIYPIADGTIISVYEDKWHALCVQMLHYNVNDGKYYTSLYVHLSSYAPGLKKGMKITSDQYIGYMGDTGKAYGIHLHLEVFPCRLYDLADSNCSSWDKYNAYAQNLVKQGYSPRKLITFPKGTYNSWSSR